MLLSRSLGRPRHGSSAWRALFQALILAAALGCLCPSARAQSDDGTADAQPAEGDAGATDSGDGQSPDDTSSGDSQAGDAVTEYFLGNTLFVFYHEIGHGLIDKLQLPVLGREEDAVDQLATIILVGQGGEDSVGGTPALTAALGWLDFWNERESAPDSSDYWDEHSLDVQRYANIVCLVYGSDPDKYDYLIKNFDMSEARAEKCPSEFQVAEDSWYGVTGDAWLPEDRKAPAGNRAFTLEYKPAEHDEYRAIEEKVKNQRGLDDAVAGLNESFVLPTPIHVVVRECGEENAFYTPETSELTMCYELLAAFLANAEKYAK